MIHFAPSRIWFSIAWAALCCLSVMYGYPPTLMGQVQRNASTGLYELTTPRCKLVTDIPIDDELQSWPLLLDQAIEHWNLYFGPLDRNRESITTVYLILDASKFEAAGLLKEVPEFDEGYQLGNRLFLREQPSVYYRRHLFLHEVTHWYMWRVFGGCGSPWYMEGMADMQGTHAIVDGKLRLGILPGSPLQVPYWGRIKAVQDSLDQETAPSLTMILAYENDRDRRIRYAWSWAACVFFSNHPKFGPMLHQVRGSKLDYSDSLSKDLRTAIGTSWDEANIDWSGFISDLEFGYDANRSIVQSGLIGMAHRLTPNTTTILATDRGWQATGIWLDAGQRVRIDCNGRYIIHEKNANQLDDKQWESEPQGITIEYYRGMPLGCVVATVQSAESNQKTNRWQVVRVGRGLDLHAEQSGQLFLKVNEPSGKLYDNRGELTITIHDAATLK